MSNNKKRSISCGVCVSVCVCPVTHSFNVWLDHFWGCIAFYLSTVVAVAAADAVDIAFCCIIFGCVYTSLILTVNIVKGSIW